MSRGERGGLELEFGAALRRDSVLKGGIKNARIEGKRARQRAVTRYLTTDRIPRFKNRVLKDADAEDDLSFPFLFFVLLSTFLFFTQPIYFHAFLYAVLPSFFLSFLSPFSSALFQIARRVSHG